MNRIVFNSIAAVMMWSMGLSSIQSQDDVPPRFNLPSIVGIDARQALSNVDDSEFASLLNFESWNPDHPTITKVLYRLPNIQARLMNSFASPLNSSAYEGLVESPEEYRAAVFKIKGSVVGFKEHRMLTRTSEAFSFDHYFIYRVKLLTGNFVDVLSRHKADAWKPSDQMDEAISCNAYFLQIAGSQSDDRLIFAASDIQWFPEHERPEYMIGFSQLVLSAMGLDYADFDKIRRRHDMPIGASEGSVLVDWIEASRHLKETHYEKIDWPKIDLVDLLQHPTQRTGQLVQLKGTARRIALVKSEDKNGKPIEYYHIDMFVDLDGLKLNYSDRDGNIREFRNSFPVTICSARLPEGVDAGAKLNVPLKVKGFFFKLWSFQSEATKNISSEKRQTSPLLVAADIEMSESGRGSFWNFRTISIAILAGVLVTFGILVAWQHLGRRKVANPAPRKAKRPESGEPDFSNIQA